MNLLINLIKHKQKLEFKNNKTIKILYRNKLHCNRFKINYNKWIKKCNNKLLKIFNGNKI